MESGSEGGKREHSRKRRQGGTKGGRVESKGKRRILKDTRENIKERKQGKERRS